MFLRSETCFEDARQSRQASGCINSYPEPQKGPERLGPSHGDPWLPKVSADPVAGIHIHIYIYIFPIGHSPLPIIRYPFLYGLQQAKPWHVRLPPLVSRCLPCCWQLWLDQCGHLCVQPLATALLACLKATNTTHCHFL